MPTFDYPYIRDTLTIDRRVQEFYDNFVGDGPVFLLARKVKHAPGSSPLKVGSRPLIIVADVYDGTGGMIDARGADATAVGAPGKDGTYPRPDVHVDGLGRERPLAPGGSGEYGVAGSPGKDGGTVTVRCRLSINAHISASGGRGTAGSAGGNGSRGVAGQVVPDHSVWHYSNPDDPTDLSGWTEEIAGETIPGATAAGEAPAAAAGTAAPSPSPASLTTRRRRSTHSEVRAGPAHRVERRPSTGI